MGGSTPVPLTDRILIWLETIPILLKHLSIEHVALVSHSAGTIYMLNTLYHLPQILYPSAPYAVLLAPWVHPSYSGVPLMRFLEIIPNGMVGHWNQVVKGVLGVLRNVVTPSVASSTVALSSFSGIFASTDGAAKERDNAKYIECFGMDIAQEEKVQELGRKYLFEEDTTGGNDEALLCLKKAEPGIWGVCEDYESYLASLSEIWKLRKDSGALEIKAIYAEDDMMSGEGGKTYFEGCFSAAKDGYNFTSSTVPGTSHETVFHPTHGAFQEIFQAVKSQE